MQYSTALHDVSAMPAHIISQQISSSNVKAPIYLSHPVAFHRVFADIAGSSNGGLFLSQLWHWTQTMYAKYGERWDGWVYKTADEWEEETGLTRAQQETVRKRLADKGVLIWSNKGRVCGVIQFYLDVRVLFCLLSQIEQKRKPKSQKCQAPLAKTPNQIQEIAKPIAESTKESSKETTAASAAEFEKQIPLAIESDTEPLMQRLIAEAGFERRGAASLIKKYGADLVILQLNWLPQRDIQSTPAACLTMCCKYRKAAPHREQNVPKARQKGEYDAGNVGCYEPYQDDTSPPLKETRGNMSMSPLGDIDTRETLSPSGIDRAAILAELGDTEEMESVVCEPPLVRAKRALVEWKRKSIVLSFWQRLAPELERDEWAQIVAAAVREEGL